MLVSIAIPCYRSATTISRVVAEIRTEFEKKTDYEYEIILVDDGSPDNTFEVIEQLCRQDDRITGINLSRNFGQSSAKMAAVRYVHGDLLVTMDDDGQHPAEGIFALVDKIMEGYDMAYAYFPRKKHSLFKRVTSWMNSKILTFMKMKSPEIHISSFVAYSKFAVRMIQNSQSPVNALSSYVRRLSKKVTDVEMIHRERMAGKSNYTLKKLFRLWKNGITSFSTQALSLSVYLGSFCAVAGFLYAAVIFVRKMMHPKMMIGYASIMIVMLVLSGIIMLLLGILGEYLGKIFLILVHLPNYYVRDEVLNKYCMLEEDEKSEHVLTAGNHVGDGAAEWINERKLK